MIEYNMTIFLLILVCFFYIVDSKPSTRYLHPDIGLTPKQVIKKYGYPLETHRIVTLDGYILETYRIPHGLNNSGTGSRQPVLLFPGLACTASIFLTLGPGLSLGFILADEDYDVWLANYRGTTFSKKHKRLHPVANKKDFFNYSFQEIGLSDVTANIDYILNVTGYKQLYYVGHSQGTTSFFAMAADNLEYSTKVKLMIALAPVVYAVNVKHILFPFFKQNFERIKRFSNRYGIYEILAYQPLLAILGQIFCNDAVPTQPLCEQVLYFVGGCSPNLNKTVIPLVTSNNPGGASARMLFHYVQLGLSGDFEKYDFGKAENKKRYGYAIPPKFDIGRIQTPVAIYYGGKDTLSTAADVELLGAVLPNVAVKLFIDDYNHLDFLWAKNVVPKLYSHIVEDMKLYS